VPTFFPLLKTFLELFSADVVQDLQCFLFHFADISKTFPFYLAFRTREQKEVALRKVGWIGRMRDNCHVVFCQKLLHTQGHVRRGIVVVKETITAAPHFWSLTWTPRQTSYLRNLVNGPTMNCIDCVANFLIFSSFWRVEGRPDLGWSSHDISPPFKREYHLYTLVFLKASSLKASCSIKTVSAPDFPNRK